MVASIELNKSIPQTKGVQNEKKHVFQKLTAVVLLFALTCPIGVHAMAVEEWESTKTTYRYAGYNYDGWTILYHDHDGKMSVCFKVRQYEMMSWQPSA